jgi:hypothetical protein
MSRLMTGGDPSQSVQNYTRVSGKQWIKDSLKTIWAVGTTPEAAYDYYVGAMHCAFLAGS